MEAKQNVSEDNLKIHLAVEVDDIEKALSIVSRTVKEHNVGVFKCMTRPHRVDSNQFGKEFTIFPAKDRNNPAVLQPFLRELEQRLQEAGVRRGPIGKNIRNGDRPVNGGIYSFYRYNLENASRDKFCAPESGDIMEFVSLQPSSKGNHWYNKDRWSVIENYNVLEHVETLNEQDKNNLFQFLESLNLGRNFGNITYDDGSVTKGLVVSRDELTFLPALYRKEWQKEEEAKKVNQWYEKDAWRIIDDVLVLDNTDMLDDKQRIALGCFLQSNHIAFTPVSLEHRDKTSTTAIDVYEQPETFFNRLQQYKTLMAQPKGKQR